MGGGGDLLKGPLGGLSTNWLYAAEDCVELRLAAALSSVGGLGEVGPFRGNIGPIEPQRPFAYGLGSGQVAWKGGTLAARMGSVLRRRLIDFERLICESLPLRASIELVAEDVVAFIEGRVDEALLEDLLFGLTWIDWHKRTPLREIRARWRAPIARTAIPPAYALLKSVLDPTSEIREPR